MKDFTVYNSTFCVRAKKVLQGDAPIRWNLQVIHYDDCELSYNRLIEDKDLWTVLFNILSE